MDTRAAAGDRRDVAGHGPREQAQLPLGAAPSHRLPHPHLGDGAVGLAGDGTVPSREDAMDLEPQTLSAMRGFDTDLQDKADFWHCQDDCMPEALPGGAEKVKAELWSMNARRPAMLVRCSVHDHERHPGEETVRCAPVGKITRTVPSFWRTASIHSIRAPCSPSPITSPILPSCEAAP